MFRHRARSDTPPLDEATAERMLDGAPIDDISDSQRRVLEILGILAQPATPDELEGAAAAAATFVTAHDAANQPAHRTRPVVALAVTTVLLAFSTGTAFAATEGALPEPVQAVAHEALGVVGISVPGITPDHPDPASNGVTPADVHPIEPGSDGTGTLGTIEPVGATSGASSTASGGAGTASNDKTTGSDGTTGTSDGSNNHDADDPASPTPADPPGPGDPKPAPKPKPAPAPKPAPEPKDTKDPKQP